MNADGINVNADSNRSSSLSVGRFVDRLESMPTLRDKGNQRPGSGVIRAHIEVLRPASIGVGRRPSWTISDLTYSYWTRATRQLRAGPEWKEKKLNIKAVK
jgi:hypothetical protein